MITDVLIHSPFPRQDGQGNSATADRLEKILIEAGFSVEVEAEWYSGAEARCLIALNARRSAGAVQEFRDSCPNSSVIVVLTGTDINHPEIEDEASDTRQTMRDADLLVVLHEGSLPAVPDEVLEKCHVIYPSVQLPDGLSHQLCQGDEFEIIMAGNVRAEKNLPVVLGACQLLAEVSESQGGGGDEASQLVVRVYGDAGDDIAFSLLSATAGQLPFQWKGKTDHANLMRLLAGARLLLNSSTQEGGANAVCEAISLGLPVVASDIPGNVGMLGADYEGYFASGDARALSEMLVRSSKDEAFYRRLTDQVTARTPLFAYAEESKRWVSLLGSLARV